MTPIPRYVIILMKLVGSLVGAISGALLLLVFDNKASLLSVSLAASIGTIVALFLMKSGNKRI